MEGFAMKIKTKKGEINLPCFDVKLVAIDSVVANTYNPNHVSPHNMDLLETSILDNGFCYPIVTTWDPDQEKYVIIDGWHRYFEFRDRLGAREIPIIDLQLTAAQRMAATVQFNRARGVHQVELMADLVKSLADQGMELTGIAKKLGMPDEEVFRLLQVYGFSELYKNQAYSRAWVMEDIQEGEADGV